MIKMPKLQQMTASNNQFFLTLPKQIVMAKGWLKGDQIKVELDTEGNLVIKKTV